MRLGIDIGGTKTAVVVLDGSGEVVVTTTGASGRGPDDVLARAVALARHAMAGLADVETVTSVGVCVPGLVDRASGVVRHAVNLDVDELDLRRGVGDALGLVPEVDNDVKAAAVAAYTRVGPGDVEALGYLNAGTGLAAAVVRADGVVRGPGGVAGEIGHIPVGGDVACACGQTGCLETVASGTALRRMWPGDGDVMSAAADGDEAATQAVRALACGLAVAVQMLVVASGVGQVVVSGGLTRAGQPLLDEVRAEQRRRAAGSPFLAALQLDARVSFLDPDVPWAAVGAALLGATPYDGGAVRR